MQSTYFDSPPLRRREDVGVRVKAGGEPFQCNGSEERELH